MKKIILLILIANFYIAAYYSPGMTMIDSHQNQSHQFVLEKQMQEIQII